MSAGVIARSGKQKKQLKADQICLIGSPRNISSELSVLPVQVTNNLVNLEMSASRQVR